MDEKLNINIKPSDSPTTSGEYEIVAEVLEEKRTPLGASPTLNIANNGNISDLEKNLTEVIHELDESSSNVTVAKEISNLTGPSTTTELGKFRCYDLFINVHTNVKYVFIPRKKPIYRYLSKLYWVV